MTCTPELSKRKRAKTSAEALPPGPRFDVKRCDLARVVAITVGIARWTEGAESCDTTAVILSNEHARSRCSQGSLPHLTPLIHIERIEHHIGQKTSICGLPGLNMDTCNLLNVWSRCESSLHRVSTCTANVVRNPRAGAVRALRFLARPVTRPTGGFNAPVQRRAAQRTVRGDRLLGGRSIALSS